MQGSTPENGVPDEASKRESLLDWFARNPKMGLAGTVASILGLILAPILYYAADKHREIVYQTSASPTTIVRSGQSSGIRVFFGDSQVTSDVSSMQVAIWNTGRESIRSGNVLSKVITLKIDPTAKILDARVKRVTRDLVKFRCQIHSLEYVSCSWDILEGGDGALLELIFLGNSSMLTVAGDIEGRVPIRAIIPLDFNKRPADDTRLITAFVVPLCALLILGSVMVFAALRDADQKPGSLERRMVRCALLLALLMILVGGWRAIALTLLLPKAPFPL